MGVVSWVVGGGGGGYIIFLNWCVGWFTCWVCGGFFALFGCSFYECLGRENALYYLCNSGN